MPVQFDCPEALTACPEMSSKVSIRPVVPADIPQINQIFAYYVQNTLLSFHHYPPSDDFMLKRYVDATSRGLPYLVATMSADDPDQVASQTSQGGMVVGFAHASSYQATKLGYGHTVEITIFCHHEHTHQGTGVGSLLLTQLFSELRSCRHLVFEEGYEDRSRQFTVKKVLAIVADDDWNFKSGSGFNLRRWYCDKWGFEEIARFKGVGEKMGRSE